MTAFDKEDQAKKAKTELLKRPTIEKVSISRIAMEISENDGEIEYFALKRSLVVVVRQTNGSVDFLGRYVEGRPSAYPLDGAWLWANGMQSIRSFGEALRAAKEARRQTGGFHDGLNTGLATFSLRKYDD